MSLSRQLRRHVRAYVAGAVVLGAFQFSMNRIDWLAKAAVDQLFGANPEGASGPVVRMLGFAIFAFVARVASRWFIFNAGRDVEYELRGFFLERLHKLGAAFYRKMSAGELMSRASSDLLQVRMLFGFGILNMVNVVFAFASALQVMTAISLKLTLAAFVMLPVLIPATRSMSRGLFTRTRANQDAVGKLSDVLQRNLAGVRVVRSFALETRELRRFEEASRAYLEASLSLARLRGFMGPVIASASALGVLVFFWYGGVLLLQGPAHGGITDGAFFAFWLAFGRMTWPMIALGFTIGIVQRGRAGYTRLREVFEAVPEVTDGPLAAPDALRGSLTVKNLTFAYGNRKVLDGVSFHVDAGESLAILGRTGAGKSTLAMLLPRLLPAPEGAIFVDGHDVCTLPLAFVRRSVGYAQQDAFLFSTTVAHNVGLSLDDPDTDESSMTIRTAIREAAVEGEVLALAEQYDTVVGERGVQLSGGQKQRVALARAFVREPTILVLDDPMSAVDAKTEQMILDAIDRQASRRTLVLITHRVATAARCKSILVLDAGRVVEVGTHEELLAAGGLYAMFAEEQSMAAELEDLDVAEVSSRAAGGAV